MSERKISVVIPVYNAGSVLRRMVDSVLSQTERDFECILLNDGSNDNGETERILGEYAGKDARIKVVNKENSGVQLTRDEGVRLASGKYVYVCDQDDYLHPQMLEFCFWACEKYDLDLIVVNHFLQLEKRPLEVVRLGDFNKVEIAVVDNICPNWPENSDCFQKLHIDPWSRFQKRELALKFPVSENDVTCTYVLAENAKRWGVIRGGVPLYYYYCDREGSLINKLPKAEWVTSLHHGWAKVLDIYDDKANREKCDEIRRAVHKVVALQVFGYFRMIKRRTKKYGFCRCLPLWGSLGDMLADFLFFRGMGIEDVGGNHWCKYCLIAMIFGWRQIVKGLWRVSSN